MRSKLRDCTPQDKVSQRVGLNQESLLRQELQVPGLRKLRQGVTSLDPHPLPPNFTLSWTCHGCFSHRTPDSLSFLLRTKK